MVLAPVVVALAAAPHVQPCAAALRRGPAVPAPIVLRTSCGGFRLARDGRVTRLPRRWFARHAGGTGRRFGADLSIRRNRSGRMVLQRHGRVVWRSSGVYPRDAGDVAFGPHAFAFASYRRGVFVTNLRSPERLVVRGRGLYPFGYTRTGLLIVVGGRSIRYVSSSGRARSFPIRRGAGFAFDDATDTMYFVTRDGWLTTTHGEAARHLRRLGATGGSLGYSRPGVLVFYGAYDVTVLRLDGRFLARASWRRSRLRVFDSGLSVSPDGRSYAFRLTDARPGAPGGSAVVYVLRAGERRVHAIYRHRLGPVGCAGGAGFSWNAGFLLYNSSDGDVAVLDPRGRRPLSLVPLARSLPRVARPERASVWWAADFA